MDKKVFAKARRFCEKMSSEKGFMDVFGGGLTMVSAMMAEQFEISCMERYLRKNDSDYVDDMEELDRLFSISRAGILKKYMQKYSEKGIDIREEAMKMANKIVEKDGEP